MDEKQPTTIDRGQLEKMLADALPRNDERRIGYALVNVLSHEQFEEEHIPGSINIPRGQEDTFEQRFDRGKEIVLYCASPECDASPRVAEELVRRGFQRVVDYAGGLSDWKQGGGETEGRAPQATREPGGGAPAAARVTGAFPDPGSAEEAVRALVESNFAPEEISILVKDREGVHEEPVRHRTGVGRGAGIGLMVGAGGGALLGFLAAAGVVPASEIAFFQTEPALAALKSAGAGAFVGLIFGAVAGLAFWKDEAEIERDGGVLVAVPARDERARLARQVLNTAGADRVVG